MRKPVDFLDGFQPFVVCSKFQLNSNCLSGVAFVLRKAGSPQLSSSRAALALRANVVNGQFVVIDFGADLCFQRIGQRMELDVGNLAAFVAEQMVVRFYDLIKAIGNTVDVQTLNKTCLVHCIEIIVNGRHCDRGHFQFCQKENFVRCQVAIRLL